MKTSRRTFLTALAATAAIPSFGLESKSKSMVAHHVFFWLKNPDSKADKDQLIAGIKTLKKIETVHNMYVGTVAATEKRDVIDMSWSVSELIYFADLDAQAIYQTHPLHLEFIKNCSHLWSKVVVYDVQEA